MKKIKLLFVALATIVAGLIVENADAKIWRVNNKSNYNGTSLFGDNLGGTASFPVFKEVNNAVTWSAVLNGDTLHLEGSTTIYAQAVITKKLVIIGPGYFLTENPKTSNNVLDAKIAQVLFNAGSSGSQIIGVNNVSAGNTGDRIYAGVNDIVIKRCRLENDIQIESSIDGVTIVQNFFPTVAGTNAIRTNGNAFYVYPSNVVFNNNICQRTLIWAGSIIQCNNNVFDGPANALNLQFSTSEFKNNILKPVNATTNINGGSNLNVTYNTGSTAAQFGTTNNNVVVADMTTLFVTTGTSDSKYQLKPGSALGSDGTERGAFGGAVASSSYTLSGLAAIPVIYTITTTGVAGASGLPVTIEARTIK
jgi:hypothetical protein